MQFERTDSVYGHPLYSSDVLGPMAARDGALWGGYRFGGVTVLCPGGARIYMEADGLRGGSIFHIEAAPDGTVWVAARDGIASLASLLLGAFTPGVVTLVIGRLHELLAHDHDAQHAAWSRSTTMFALSQAVSGYGFSWLFAHSGGDYRAIYLVAVAAFALALLADLAVSRSRRPAG